jgi:hypothetical protein
MVIGVLSPGADCSSHVPLEQLLVVPMRLYNSCYLQVLKLLTKSAEILNLFGRVNMKILI